MTYKYFVSDIKMLTDKFITQGFLNSGLRDKLVQFRNSYFFKWAKYGLDISSCINKLFGIHSKWA